MAKNLKGKTVSRGNAYEVMVGPDPISGYPATWYVRKHYKSTESELNDPYAIVLVDFVGMYSETADTYVSHVPGLRAHLAFELANQ